MSTDDEARRATARRYLIAMAQSFGLPWVVGELAALAHATATTDADPASSAVSRLLAHSLEYLAQRKPIRWESKTGVKG